MYSKHIHFDRPASLYKLSPLAKVDWLLVHESFVLTLQSELHYSAIDSKEEEEEEEEEDEYTLILVLAMIYLDCALSSLRDMERTPGARTLYT